MAEPGVWIANGFVDVAEGRIVEVGSLRPGMSAKDHGPGVIMPALVNAHTHLSLSALAGLGRPGIGFIEWVRKLIETRAASSHDDISHAAFRAAESVRESGTGAIAEVGPVEPGTEAMRRTGIDGVLFLESLGNVTETPLLPAESNGVSYSLAGHALHTTSPEALRSMKHAAAARGSLFSMHLAESEVETEFLATGTGEWAELLISRKIDCAGWDFRSESPVARAERLGLLGAMTLAVHALDVSAEDLSILARTGTSVCVCPRSNWTLHGRLPDIPAFLDAGLAPALGTDSLASVSTLSLFDEISFVAHNYGHLSPEFILAMACANGAQALRRPDLGSLRPGNPARLIYVDLDATSPASAATALVCEHGARVEWI
jgi:cytosine/adenosine deaminase-related metal-dependent hydrolase